MNEFALILGMFIVTFGVRYILFAMADKVSFPPLLKRALNYVPIAVLTAIIFPATLISNNQINISLDNAYIAGALVAIGVSYWRKNMLLTVVAGMVAFALYRYGFLPLLLAS